MDDNTNEIMMSTLSNIIIEATTHLAENLSQSEEFLSLKTAETKLNADQEAQMLLSEFSELRQQLITQRSDNIFSENGYERLHELQSAIVANKTIQDYLMTQELAVAFLREVNQEISNLLGIDFASLARRPGGTC